MIRIILLVLSSLVLFGCSNDSYKEIAYETNESVEVLESSKSKVYSLVVDTEKQYVPYLYLEDDNTFSFTYDVLSSYLAYGSYELVDDKIKCKTSDNLYNYTFDIIDDKTIEFNVEESSELPLIDSDMSAEVTDYLQFRLVD